MGKFCSDMALVVCVLILLIPSILIFTVMATLQSYRIYAGKPCPCVTWHLDHALVLEIYLYTYRTYTTISMRHVCGARFTRSMKTMQLWSTDTNTHTVKLCWRYCTVLYCSGFLSTSAHNIYCSCRLKNKKTEI